MIGEANTRTAQEHYRDFRAAVELSRPYDDLRDRVTTQKIGGAVTNLATVMAADWAGSSYDRLVSGGNFDNYIRAEAELHALTQRHTHFYLVQAQALAKSKLAYGFRKNIWHEEAIADARDADVELNL